MSQRPPLDHLVLPTARLEVARRRLTALGFTVAPEGIHPFGTANCCVFMADGTYLEPLAIVDAEAAHANASRNVFLSHDQKFRNAVGDEGFSALVMGTNDAAADHERFTDQDISCGPMLTFSRPLVDATGKSDTATFKLAFAILPALPLAMVFACERAGIPNIDRSALQSHRNGAVGVESAVLVADDPASAKCALATVLGVEPGDQLSIEIENSAVEVLGRNAFETAYGAIPPAQDRFAAIVFRVDGLAKTRRWLDEGRVRHEHLKNGAIAVPAVPGQGALFVFKESA